jgi:hypothetical protein
MPNLAQTQTIVANQVAKKCTKDLYGIHRKNNISWEILDLKTMVLKAIDYNTSTGYLTTEQTNSMLTKISNINLNC